MQANDGAASTEEQLWQRWREQGEQSARERLIELHLPLARMTAARLYRKRFSDDVEFGDFFQFAVVGLIESVERFDARHGIKFATFASARLQGAVLDGLADMSEWRQQASVRRRSARERIESLDADGAPQDVFARLARVAVGLAIGFMLEGSGMVAEDEAATAAVEQGYSNQELRQLRRQLHGLIEQLPHKEKMIVKYHYLHQCTFDSVATILGVSKGRVSQLHKRALELLREKAQQIAACDLAL